RLSRFNVFLSTLSACLFSLKIKSRESIVANTKFLCSFIFCVLRLQRYLLKVRFLKYEIRFTKYEIRNTKNEKRNAIYEIRFTNYELRIMNYEIRNMLFGIL